MSTESWSHFSWIRTSLIYSPGLYHSGNTNLLHLFEYCILYFQRSFREKTLQELHPTGISACFQTPSECKVNWRLLSQSSQEFCRAPKPDGAAPSRLHLPSYTLIMSINACCSSTRTFASPPSHLLQAEGLVHNLVKLHIPVCAQRQNTSVGNWRKSRTIPF